MNPFMLQLRLIDPVLRRSIGCCLVGNCRFAGRLVASRDLYCRRSSLADLRELLSNDLRRLDTRRLLA